MHSSNKRLVREYLMKRKYIYHPNYRGEDRRNYMEGRLPNLEPIWKGYLPIFGPVVTVVGFIIALTVFAQTSKQTTLLANETVSRVDVMERKDIVTDNRLVNLECYYKEIKENLATLIAQQNTTNIRLSRIEDKIPK
jgi:hypothetical protein